jgi:SAM-dependent methyltransferase
MLHGLPGEFQLVRCAGCGHHYLNPRPTPDCIHHYYPETYGPHHLAEPAESPPEAGAAIAGAGKQPWYLSPPVRRIPGLRRLYYWLSESYAQIIPGVGGSPKRALELGCADGRFLERLEREGWEAEGVEPAEEPARLAQARGLRVHIGRLEPGRMQAGHFDAVFVWMVLEHLHDPLATLREIRRVTKDSGWLVFSVPNFACWERRVFGRYWYALQLPTHLHHFNPATLRQILRRSGFDCVRVIHQRNVLNFPGSVGLWLRDRFPRSRLGPALLHFTDHPGLWGTLAMAPLAILLAWLRQGGRLTVVARAGSRPADTAEAGG